MISWKDAWAHAERYEDYRREAERDRLIRQARAGVWPRVLAWLGSRLVCWGCRLQARYGSANGWSALSLQQRGDAG